MGSMKKIQLPLLLMLVSAAVLMAAVSCGDLYNDVIRDIDVEGIPLWARTSTGGTESYFYSSTAGDGGVYAVGYIDKNAVYILGEGVSVSGAGDNCHNAVIVKYNPEGNAQWAKSVTTGTENSEFFSVARGHDGIYAAGLINGTGTYTFGPGITAASANGANSVIIVKYDFNGNALWARTVSSGSASSHFRCVAVGDDGIYAAGLIYETGTFTFGPGVTAAGKHTQFNVVLVKYGFDGAAQWARTVSACSDYSVFQSVAIGDDGVYCAGHIRGSALFTFDAGVTVSGISDLHNVVIVKYGFNGTPLWARSVTAGSSTSRFNSVSAGSDGVYGAGVIWGTGSYDFGTGITAAGPYTQSNVVLVKYNFNGTAQWARTVSTGAIGSSFYATAVIDDAVYAAGEVEGSGAYTFGPGVTANGSAATGFNDVNAILVKYDSNGTAHWARTTFEGSVRSSFSGICRDGNNIYSAGYITGITRYGFGNNVHVMGDNNNYNALIVKYRSRNFN